MEKFSQKASKAVSAVSRVMTAGYLLSASATVALANNASSYVPDSPVDGTLVSWIKNVLNLVIGLAALIAVGFLVYSGIMYIVSQGDEAKIEKATKGITYAIIGLVICFVSVLVVNFVLNNVLT